MIKKNYKTNSNMYCLVILSLFIFSGCAQQTKKEKILGIQRVRIKKLENQLVAKEHLIQKMKAQKWAKEPVPVPESHALKPLKEHVAHKRWVSALRLSHKLKKDYPHSKKLMRYRVAIFKKMGLQKQAVEEINQLKKLRAQSQSNQRRQ